MRRMVAIVAAAGVGLLGMPGVAAATTVSTTSSSGFRNIVVTGDGLDNRISFFVMDSATETHLIISDLAATVSKPILVAPGTVGCSQQLTGDVDCRVDAAGGGAIGEIQVLGGAGNDSVNAETGAIFEAEMRLDGGPGNDVLQLGASHGSAVGGDGDDALTGEEFDNRFDAGPGNDTVVSGWANDTIDLGPGHDRAVSQGGSDTVLAQDGDADEVDCGPGPDNVRGDQRDSFAACETAAVIVTPDADGDGVAPPTDCNDNDPAVKPGQNEIPANGKDDDCAGGDAPATARVRARIGYKYKVHRRFTRVTSLRISDYERGIKVQLRCRGHGCPFKLRTVKRIRGKNVSLLRHVRRAAFRNGAQLQVWVTKPRTVGKALRLSFRRNHNPVVRSLCIPPGARSARAC